jgi:hypothetical protein
MELTSKLEIEAMKPYWKNLPKRKKTMKLGFGEVANNEEKSLLY